MVRQERREVVAVLAETLEPAGEGGMEPGSASLCQARVGHLPRQGVLDHVFTLARDA